MYLKRVKMFRRGQCDAVHLIVIVVQISARTVTVRLHTNAHYRLALFGISYNLRVAASCHMLHQCYRPCRRVVCKTVLHQEKTLYSQCEDLENMDKNIVRPSGKADAFKYSVVPD